MDSIAECLDYGLMYDARHEWSDCEGRCLSLARGIVRGLEKVAQLVVETPRVITQAYSQCGNGCSAVVEPSNGGIEVAVAAQLDSEDSRSRLRSRSVKSAEGAVCETGHSTKKKRSFLVVGHRQIMINIKVLEQNSRSDGRSSCLNCSKSRGSGRLLSLARNTI
jgi:hypothetical protein